MPPVLTLVSQLTAFGRGLTPLPLPRATPQLAGLARHLGIRLLSTVLGPARAPAPAPAAGMRLY